MTDQTVNVRYMVDDVASAIDFYTTHLGFTEQMSNPPAFADVRLGHLRLLLSGPQSSAGRPMPDGTKPAPGGWNRIHLITSDLATDIDRLRGEGVRFRNDVVTGPGGSQILLQDPSGNLVEAFPTSGLTTIDDDSSRPPSRLSRQLGTFDAVIIGLGSMIGAGVFAAIGPAAAAAGGGLLIGLALAAGVAYCNATSSAQLAALYPASGGTYVYGRRRLGHGWGFLAGWGFVIGKTASCAAMALTFGSYTDPDLARPLGIGAVVALTVVNLLGIRKTAWLTRAIVAVVIGSLTTVVTAALTADPTTANIGPLTEGGLSGILRAAALLFFAFAGYARIATLGEEVRNPAHTIPRAIPIALGITLAVYATVAFTALLAIGPDELAASAAPLTSVVEAGALAWAVPVVRVGAAVASLGVLLSLLAGVSRTTFAMAAERDLPGVLDAVHPLRRVPHRAEITVAAAVIGVVLVTDVRGAIGFSSFAVLFYYAVANAAAFTLSADERRWPRALSMLGLIGCGVLGFSLPAASIIGGTALLMIGATVWVIRRRGGHVPRSA